VVGRNPGGGIFNSLVVQQLEIFEAGGFVIESLTQREQEVLQLIAAGRTTKELASELGISFKTAACHRQRVLNKCGAANTAELVRRAVQKGWVRSLPVEPPGEAIRVEAGEMLFDAARIRRAIAERRKCRMLLAATVSRARTLQGQCSAASDELRHNRISTRHECDEMLSRTQELAGTVRPASNAARKAT
jgi:DNA-binding CsgD family transcriptional regulator